MPIICGMAGAEPIPWAEKTDRMDKIDKKDEGHMAYGVPCAVKIR